MSRLTKSYMQISEIKMSGEIVCSRIALIYNNCYNNWTELPWKGDTWQGSDLSLYIQNHSLFKPCKEAGDQLPQI